MHHIGVLQLQILKLDARAALFSVYRCETLTKTMNDLFQQRARNTYCGTLGRVWALDFTIATLSLSAGLP